MILEASSNLNDSDAIRRGDETELCHPCTIRRFVWELPSPPST